MKTSTLDRLLAAVVADTDPKAPNEALKRLMQYAEAIAMRRMSAAMRGRRQPSSICQSVFADLVKADGNIDGKPKHFENEQAVLRYLQRCIEHKIAEEARKRRRLPEPLPQGSDGTEVDPADRQPSAHDALVVKELLLRATTFKATLKPAELQILQLRQTMKSWDQISTEVGLTAVNCRKIFQRLKERFEIDLSGQ